MLSQTVKLTDNLYIGPTPNEELCAELKTQGVKTIVSFCRAGELSQEIDPKEEAKLVRKAGMSFMNFPVSISTVKNIQIDEFRKKLNRRHAPFYLHCRLGQRATPLALILMHCMEGVEADTVLKFTQSITKPFGAPILSTLVSTYIEREQRRLAA